MEEKNKNVGKLDSFFGVTKANSTIKVEILSGIATFLAMAYILTVNPNSILFGGTLDPRWPSVFIATALGAVIGTLLMALLAKMPLAQASGMGLNSQVGLVIGGAMGFAFSYGNAMLLVLISGIVFVLVSVIPVGKNKQTGVLITLREAIFVGMPKAVRTAIPVGIGLFIAFIGLQNAQIVSANPFTLLQFVDLKDSAAWATGGAARTAVVGLFSFVVIAILSHFKVKGAVVIGILLATLLAWPLGVTDINILLGKTDGVKWAFWENFQTFFSFDETKGGIFGVAFQGFDMPEGSIMTCVMLVITFAMIDMFDTMGTVVGCCANANLLDENGVPQNYNKIMLSDSIATCTGAILGTSTVTTFVESGAGVAVGGKTGLTALTAAILFFLAIFLLPVFAFIPTAAAAGALLYVGVLMMSNVKSIDFHDPKDAVPAFVTIAMMPLTYSITNGIGLGLISYVVISLFVFIIRLILHACGKAEKPKWDISVVAIVITLLFLVYFLVPTIF
jgi:permeases